MKRIYRHIAIILALAALSCDGKFQLINCPDCEVDEPTSTVVTVKLETRTRFSNVTVRVYEGNLEDNILRSTHSPAGGELEVTLYVNKLYTFEAEYTDTNGDIYIAVDTAYPRVRLDKQQCESWCYYVYDKKVNLVIKYN